MRTVPVCTYCSARFMHQKMCKTHHALCKPNAEAICGWRGMPTLGLMNKRLQIQKPNRDNRTPRYDHVFDH